MSPQPPASHSSSDDALLIGGLMLAIFAGAAGFLWWRYHIEIATAVMAAQHCQIDLIRVFTDRYDALDAEVLAADPAHVKLGQLFHLCHLVGSFFRIPAALLVGTLAALCLNRAAPARFCRNLDLEGLMRVQAKLFRTTSAFVGRNLGLVPLADGVVRPADPSFRIDEWMNRFARTVRGRFDPDLAREELVRQLGPIWTGPATASAHVRCLFAAFALHAARRREEALELLGDMAESLPRSKADGPAGPVRPLMLPSRVVDRADAWLRDPEIALPATKIAARHGYTSTALMSLLSHARSRAGVLAPAQFNCLKLVDRHLWYALHSLGFPSSPTWASDSLPTPLIEALGSRHHWAAETEVGQPLGLPMLDAAVDFIRASQDEAARTNKHPSGGAS